MSDVNIGFVVYPSVTQLDFAAHLKTRAGLQRRRRQPRRHLDTVQGLNSARVGMFQAEASQLRLLAPVCTLLFILMAWPVASQDRSDEWYVRLFAGATFPQVDDFEVFRVSCCNLSEVVDPSFDTGWAIGGAVGRHVTRDAAFELELTYRRANGRTDGPTFFAQNGTAWSTAVILNAFYDLRGFGRGEAWRPYLGAGMGAAYLSAEADHEITDNNPELDAAWVPAYQAAAGLGYDLTPRLRLFGEVRWLGVFSTEWGSRFVSFDSDSGTIDVLIGLRSTARVS